MNCIDCFWCVQQDKMRQCKKANQDIRFCEGYTRARKEVVKTNEQ